MRVSFVIPFKGNELDLIQLIKRNKEMLTENHELVIVFDAKSDLKEIERKNLKVKKNINVGIYEAMNKGIQIASNEFIFFMGQTDTVYVSELRDLNLTYDSDFIEFKFQIGSKIKANNPGKDLIYHHQSIIFRKEFLQNHNIQYDENLKIHSDYELILNTIFSGAKKAKYSNRLCKFERGGISTTKKNIVRSLSEIYKIQQRYKVFGFYKFTKILVRRLSYLIR